MGYSSRAEEDRIDETEDRGVRADANRQRQHRNNSDALTLQEHLRAVAQIIEHLLILSCSAEGAED
jgi:hypothetical protein